jgi:hypothetical protein
MWLCDYLCAIDSIFQRMNFSTFSEKELTKLDIHIQDLIFNDNAIDQLISSTVEDNAMELVMRLKDIYAHVNMDVSFERVRGLFSLMFQV